MNIEVAHANPSSRGKLAWKTRIVSLLHRKFIRDIFTLLSGTTLAQLITVGLSPILTRIYGPVDFGMYALYASVVTLAGAGSTLRYGQAIFMAKTVSDAEALFCLCLGISSVLSLIMLMVGGVYVAIVGPDAVWILYCPLALLATGVIEAVTFWLSRNQAFKMISVGRVSISLATIALQLLLGWSFSGNGLSLIASQVFANVSVAILLLWYSQSRFKLKFLRPSWNRTRSLLREFKNFPIFTLPTDLISTFVAQAPVFFFAHYLTKAEVGQYSLTMRVLGVPLVFLASAVGEVFRQRASAEYLATGNCQRVFKQSLIGLGALSLTFFSGLFVFGPALIVEVFGDQWQEAGLYTRILSIMFFWRFISSPLSFTYYIVGRQREDFLVQVFNAVLTPSALYLGYLIQPSASSVLLSFTLGTSVVQILYLVRSFQFSLKRAS